MEIPVPRLVPSLALVAALGAALSPAVTAQVPAADPDDSWTVRAIADVGMRVGIRDLGTNGGETVFSARLAVRSGIETAPVVGMGVELRHRHSNFGVRTMARTTLGGRYTGRPGACVLIEGAVCESYETDVRVSSFTVEALLGTRRQADARLSISLGAGLRRYEFGGIECATDEVLCLMVRQIQSDQLQPLLTFGLTLEGEVEGLPVHVKVQDFLGSFRAGSAPAEGQLQNDLIVTLGIGFPLN